jgi:hypothetical protein
MPQGRMTEEQAYALAKKQRAANDLRRAGGSPSMPPKMANSAGATGGPSFPKNPMATGNPNGMLPKGIPGAGGFKGIETPGQSIRALENGKFVYRSGSGITSDEGPTDAPKPTAPERKVNMQSGMGNTNAKEAFKEKPSIAQGMLASNPLEYIKKTPGAMNNALGFGTDMLKRGLEKNTGMVKQDYIDRLKGSDVFRKLDSASQGHVMKAYQQWLGSQSAFNEGKRNQVESQRQLKQNIDEGANYGF